MLRALAGEHRLGSTGWAQEPQQASAEAAWGQAPAGWGAAVWLLASYRTQAVLSTPPAPQTSQISPVKLRGSESLQILTFNLSMYFRKLKPKALVGNNNSTFVYWGSTPIVKTSPAVLPDGMCVLMCINSLVINQGLSWFCLSSFHNLHCPVFMDSQ